jgi:hypothetical protein
MEGTNTMDIYTSLCFVAAPLNYNIVLFQEEEIM